jgi:hypothetical protein
MMMIIDDDDDGSDDDDGNDDHHCRHHNINMIMLCYHGYDDDNYNDIQVSCVFIYRAVPFMISSCTYLSIMNSTS